MAGTSDAARELVRARWGDTRVRRLVDELVRRISEVDPEQAEKLTAALAEAEQQREAA